MPKMKHPLVTVLMAVRNEETYLGEAINSILGQTFDDFEFLIVDDGSEDTTPQILQEIPDERVRVVRVTRQGLTNSLNTGLQMSRGRFIARMDGDDISYPQRLEMQVAQMRSRPDLALLGTWYNTIDEDRTVLATHTLPVDDPGLKSLLFASPPRNPLKHGSVMVRKDALEQAGGYRAEFITSQDYDLWLRLSEGSTIGVVPQVLYSWRLRRGAIGTTMRMRQRAFGRAALLCAEQRRSGVQETLPSFGQNPGISLWGPLKSLERDSGYNAAKANLLLQSGIKWRATRAALRSVLVSPWSLIAWAAVIRTQRAWFMRR